MAKVRKTVHGIRLDIDPRIFTDVAFVDAMTLLMEDEDTDDEEEQASRGADAMKAVKEMAGIVFGDNLKKIQKKLRDENDGFLDYETWIQFIVDVMGTYQKNSDARPAAGEE